MVLLLCALCVSGSWAARHARHFSNSEAVKERVNRYGDTRKDEAAMNAESWQEVFDEYDVDIDEFDAAAEDMLDEYDEEVDGNVDAAEDIVNEFDEEVEKLADTVDGAMGEYVDEYMRYLNDQREEFNKAR